ncbi:adhesion G protein-coupled receptor L4-like [Lineus longissimus]|uniref:adhesion G protein-coupled receptor L4-like n=1 Tax=Lineus longissimus TaxID=88925 RepID=UPI00315D0169
MSPTRTPGFKPIPTTITSPAFITKSTDLSYEILMRKPVSEYACSSAPGSDRTRVYDPLTRSCRETRRCDMSHVEWNETCLRDPFDRAYTTPILGPDGFIAVELQVRITGLKIITSGNTSYRDTASEDFRSALSSYLFVAPMDVANITVQFDETNLTEFPLIGGKELTFGSDTLIDISFLKLKNNKNVTMEMLNIVSFLNRVENKFFGRGFLSSFRVYSHAVSLPLKCSQGDFVRVPYDYNLKGYLQHVDADVFNRQIVLELLDNETLNFILCDVFASKFDGCEIVSYNRSSFRQNNDTGELTYLKTGELMSLEHVIGDEKVYICIRDGFLIFLYTSKVPPSLTFAGVALSLLFLVMTLVTHLVHKSLRTLPGMMLMNLCANLLVAQLLFITAVSLISDRLSCQIMAMVNHYFWLATFFWMNAIAMNLTLTFAGGMKAMVATTDNLRTKILKYSAYAYGVPAVVVITCGLLDKLGNVRIGYGPDLNEEGACWFTKEQGLIYAFVVPLALIIAMNAILFIVASVSIARTKKLGAKAKGVSGQRLEFLLYLKLSLLMGFTWIFGFIGTFTDNVVMWYLFVILNSLQGVFIGLAFGFNKRIFVMWRDVTTTSSRAPSTGTTNTTTNTRL